MLFFFAALFATITLIRVIERFAEPRRAAHPVFHRLSMLSMMPPVVFFVTMFMVSYRPFFSLLLTLVVFIGIVVVNNAKMAILREPLVFSDFALLRQAVQYPALYIKYVGVGKVVMVVTTGIAVVVGAIVLEPPVINRTDLDDTFPTLVYLATILGLIYAVTRGPLRGAFRDLLYRFGPTANVEQDMDKLSLVVCLIFYFVLANEEARKPQPRQVRREPTLGAPTEARRRAAAASVWSSPKRLPDLIAVQSESFFDARRLHPSIPKTLLARYDACASAARYRGRLSVPAWGANTMRTEFAFLSGLPNEALGYHRFNPYLSLCKKPTWTMAHLLRSMGYRTVCIHPFHASFFDRETVIPNLGFDEFLDIEDFGGAETFGPYVSDVALADKVCAVLSSGTQPTFIFAITMENHGKWERGRLDDCPSEDEIDPEPLGSYELGCYLRHLRNTDRMVERIVAELKARSADSLFCLFGDHVPSFPVVYRAMQLDDPRTDYFIWRKGGSHPQDLDTSADVLGRLMLDVALNGANHDAAPTAAPVPVPVGA